MCSKPRELGTGRKGAGLLGAVTLGAVKVVRHLQARPSEAALDVESLVVLAAVEDGLVTPGLLGDEVERLDQVQAQLLALLVLGDGDVLDVADGAEIVDAGEEKRCMLARLLPASLGGETERDGERETDR